MPHSPPKPAAQQRDFDTDVHETSNAATYFAPDTLPLPKVHRAWERKPVSPFMKQNNIKKVWRRYDTKAGPRGSGADALPPASKSPKRVMKKLRLAATSDKDDSMASGSKGNKGYRATKWDRRRSALPRKRRIPLLTEQSDEAADEEAEGSEDSISSISNTPLFSLGKGGDESQTEDTELDPPNDGDISDLQTSDDSLEQIADITESLGGSEASLTFTDEADEASAQEQLKDVLDFDNQQDDIQTIEAMAGTDVEKHKAAAPQQDATPELPPQQEPLQPLMEPSSDSTELEGHTQESPISPRETSNSNNINSETRNPTDIKTPEAMDIQNGVQSTSETSTPPAMIPEGASTSKASSSEEPSTGAVDNITKAPTGSALDQQQSLASPSEVGSPRIEDDKCGTKLKNFKPVGVEEIQDTPHKDLVEDAGISECDGPVVEIAPDAVVEEDDICTDEPEPPTLEEDDLTVKTQEFDLVLNSTNQQRDIAATRREQNNDDITAGLTLTSPTETEGAAASDWQSEEEGVKAPVSGRPENDITENDITVDFNEDTALLMDFLDRAAANKANKAAINQQESLSHRRDSDAIRQALASPRKALENKDPNVASPSKPLSLPENVPSSPIKIQEPVDKEDTANIDATVDAARPQTRRSSRSRQTRIPPPSAAANVPGRITIRMPNDIFPVQQKSEAQELAALTKGNTRRNKGKAVPVPARLKYLKAMQMAQSSSDRSDPQTPAKETDGTALDPSKRSVTWDEQLAYTQDMEQRIINVPNRGCLSASRETKEFKDFKESERVAAGGSEGDGKQLTGQKRKSKPSKEGTPVSKIRRLRDLGASSDTPTKDLLANATFLSPEVQKDRSATSQDSFIPTSIIRTPKQKSRTLPQLQIQPSITSVMSPDVRQRHEAITAIASGARIPMKSRLAAPKKVVLPGITASSVDATITNGSSEGLSSGRPVKRKTVK